MSGIFNQIANKGLTWWNSHENTFLKSVGDQKILKILPDPNFARLLWLGQHYAGIPHKS